MPEKEATARIKINRLLEAAGWRFFADGALPANIRLEPGIALKSHDLDALGNDFDKTAKGFVDFLLLDAKGFPLLVLEAKAERKKSPASSRKSKPPSPACGAKRAVGWAKRSVPTRFYDFSNIWTWPFGPQATRTRFKVQWGFVLLRQR